MTASFKDSLLRLCGRETSRGRFEVPYQDFHAENTLYMDEIVTGLAEVFSLKDAGEQEAYVRAFTRDYASRFGARYGVGVSSGTTALCFSLLALDIGPGDEVITTAHTYIATALAIQDAGAKPVFVDVKEDCNIDADKMRAALSPKTKAVIPVHLYGLPCEIEKIMESARRHGLRVVEDACQAQGSQVNGRSAGTFGETGCFSFHASKLIGALGDGGIVLTDDARLAERVERLKEARHDSADVLRSRRTPAALDPIHVPFLAAKLRHLDDIVANRHHIAGIYDEELSRVPQLILPKATRAARTSYRNYTLRAENRDGLLAHLASRGIEARRFYEIPLHLRKEFAKLGYEEGAFPVCEKLYKQILSLPISHALEDRQVRLVCREIRAFYQA